MRILLVAPQPFYRERGTPIAVKLLVEELCSAGHRVDLLVYHDGEDISIPGMRLFRAGRPPGVTNVPIGLSPQKLACDLWLIGKMIGLLRETRYDVIHAVEEALFPAAVLARWFGTRLVYDMDSSLSAQVTEKLPALRPLLGLMEAVENPFMRRADVVLAVCEDLAARARRVVPDPACVTVLPDVPMGDDGTVVEEAIREGLPDGVVVGLYVGNLEHYQGIDLLLESLRELPAESPFRMVVIGGNAEAIARYEAMARDLGVQERLRFLGPRALAQLGGYLAQADVLVSPRILGQNTPMKIYSYMQAGKAILATDIRSHTQALTPDSALLVPPVPAAMAAGLGRLAAEPALRARLGAAARRLAEEEFSLAAFRRRLALAYQRIGARAAGGIVAPATALAGAGGLVPGYASRQHLLPLGPGTVAKILAVILLVAMHACW